MSCHEMQIEGHKIVALSFNKERATVPIIFIHGITASVNSWVIGQVPVFEKFPWLSLGLPGHYPATFPPDLHAKDLTAEMMARILTTAIHKLVGEQPVILIGHSTGAFAALSIAAHTPDIARGVCSMAGFARGKWTGALGILQRLARFGSIGRAMFKASHKILASSRAMYKNAFKLYAVDRRAIYSQPGLKAFINLNYPDRKHLDANAMLHYFERMPDIDIGHLLPRITAPTLLLAGDSDPIVPPAQSRLIAAKVPNSELVSFKGVGHLPATERTREYHRIITDWVEKIA